MPKKLILMPTHDGINTMPWAWLLSQSPDLISAELPPHQFIPLDTSNFGMYPNIHNDLFAQDIRTDSANGNLAMLLDDLQRYDRNTWKDDNLVDKCISEIVNIISEQDLPGLIVIPNNWITIEKCQALKETHSTEAVEIQTVFVKSNLRIHGQGRWYFLYNAFGDLPAYDKDIVSKKIIDVVSSEVKHSKSPWTLQVNIADSIKINMVEDAFNVLGLAIPETINQAIDRIKIHNDAITKPNNDPFDGIESLDWDLFIAEQSQEYLDALGTSANELMLNVMATAAPNDMIMSPAEDLEVAEDNTPNQKLIL